MTYCPHVKHQNCTTEIPRDAEHGSKIAIMVVTLVKESNGKSNSEIEAAILARLQDVRVPWMKQVDKITVLDA